MKLKNWVSKTILSISVFIVLVNLASIEHFNLFFTSISINIVVFNHYIMKKYSSKRFIEEYLGGDENE